MKTARFQLSTFNFQLLLCACLLACGAASVCAQDVAVEESRPVDLRLGAFDFHPRLRAAATYDDNILFSKTTRQEDVITTVAPGLQILGGDRLALLPYLDRGYELMQLTAPSLVIQPEMAWPGKFLVFDYSPRWKFYADHDNNDSLDHLLDFSAVWPMSKLILGFNQSYHKESTAIIEAGQLGDTERISTSADAAYQFSEKTSADLRLWRTSQEYPGSTNLTGYVEWAATLGLNYQVTSTVVATLAASGGLNEVEQGGDQQFAQVIARGRYWCSDLLTFDASVGLEYRAFDTGRSSTLDPVFSLGTEYRPWERTSFRLAAAHRQYASVYNNTYYANTGGNLTIRQGITDRFSTTLDLGYYYTDYQPTADGLTAPPPSDYYNARLTLNVKIRKHLDGSVFYLYRGRGAATDYSLQNQQAGVQLELSY